MTREAMMREMAVCKAIVTDGLWRKSMSAVRSLGKAGYHVCVFGDSYITTAFWSRYASSRVVCPVAKDAQEKFGQALLEHLKRSQGLVKPVLFPMEDATLEWVSANRSALSSYADFLLPPNESLLIAQSKFETNKLAAELDLPVPETFSAESPRDIALKITELSNAASLQHYIVKPVSGSGSAGIIYLGTQVSTDWQAHWQKFGPLIIQKRIDAQGQGLGVSVLFDRDGECITAFAHARLQEYPNSGGPSTARISIHDEALVEKSIRLLKALRWQGVAMVEWKQDPVDHVPKLLEINPRFWGSLELAVRSGIDFPYLYARAAAGKPCPEQQTYRAGVVCRWMFPGEILRYLTQDKEKRERLCEFFSGLPALAEEWDRSDIRGSVSAILCPLLSALNPKYWKYLNR